MCRRIPRRYSGIFLPDELKMSRKKAVCELADGSFFIYHKNRKRVISTKNWRERLVKCGIPEVIAQRIIDFFFKRRRLVELMAYIRMTEEATGRADG